MPRSRQQILEALNSKAELMTGVLRAYNPEYTLWDLTTLAVITLMHASTSFPDWNIAAKKLVSDLIDAESEEDQKDELLLN